MVDLGLISLGRGETGPGEGLERGIWGIFWLGGDDGGCDGCTDDGGCTGVEGRRGELTGVVMMLVLGRSGEMGMGWGVGRKVVVGGGLVSDGRRVGSASVDPLRVIIMGELIHGGVVRGGLAIV